ncbi:MAG: diguanylate cyclase [Gammaproteobacteria bacterium]|nr:diguanylate cyclase [Gammaproteobacteria bacterium]
MPETKVANLADSRYADAQRLRQQYVAALSQFIAKLSLSSDALQRVKSCLANARSSPVEALLEQLATELQMREGDTKGAATVADSKAIENVLLTLFDRMTLVPTTENEAKRHKEILLAGIAAEQLPRFVNDLAELINQSLILTQREKKELEEFVESIVGKLRAFASFVESVQSDLRESRSNQADLRESWDAQVHLMTRDVAQATNLDGLKRDVNAQLERMRESMTTFREKETDRIRRSEDRSEQLHGKLQEMETEAAELRNQIQENRAQLLLDAVTGVNSRFAYEERMDLEFIRWKRFAAPLSFLLWDIDFFKSINDTFGHQAGDRVLRLVAQLINNRIRESDFFARVGGEEFAMLLPGTGAGDAQRIAEEIRATVDQSGFNHKGNPVQITVSCGLTEFRSGDTPELVFERADESLHKAKQSGRNRVVAT